VLVAACSGQKANSGLNEPFQVSGGQFIPGDLPGTPPPDGGTGGGGEAGAAPSPLTISTVGSTTGVLIISGVGGKSFSGLVSPDAVAIGVRFADMGTGYWVVPVQNLDPEQGGQRDFGLTASFNPTDRPGYHPLVFVGLGSDGSAGPQFSQNYCVESRIPDNLHACQPMNPVPAAVFSLRWDSGFDLDLHVTTPDGWAAVPPYDITPKGDQIIADAALPPTTTPAQLSMYSRIDRDSMGNCVPDGWHQEDLIFETYPTSGPYDIYADPYAACGQSSVRFTLTIYEPGPDGNLRSTWSQSGELNSSQVTGGLCNGDPSSPPCESGLFIGEKVFN
jgi:hypothetical protein